MTFNELNLSAPLLKAVSEAGYETPSPIQASAIPPVLEGRDLMGCAQTGTGKTAAFALPMLDRLSGAAPRKKGAIRALILTPTRELALQIGESFDAYGKYLKLRSTFESPTGTTETLFRCGRYFDRSEILRSSSAPSLYPLQSTICPFISIPAS